MAKEAANKGNVLLPTWLNQKNIFSEFTHVQLRLFSGLGILVKHRSWYIYIYMINAFIRQALEAELSGRFAHCETVCAKGQSLIDRGHYASKEIRAKIKQLQNNWMKLRELLITRSERLKDAAQSLQVC